MAADFVVLDRTSAIRWTECAGDDPKGLYRAFGGGSYKLQMLWRGDDGSEEWIDVPFNLEAST